MLACQSLSRNPKYKSLVRGCQSNPTVFLQQKTFGGGQADSPGADHMQLRKYAASGHAITDICPRSCGALTHGQQAGGSEEHQASLLLQ